MRKPSRVFTIERKRVRSRLYDGNMKRIVRMSRTMKRAIDDTKITFVLPDVDCDHERLGTNGNKWEKPDNVRGGSP